MTPFESKKVNFLLNKPMLEKPAPPVAYVVKFAREYLNRVKHVRNAMKMNLIMFIGPSEQFLFYKKIRLLHKILNLLSKPL